MLSPKTLIPFTLVAMIASPAFAAGSIQITGHGEVSAAPDTAYVTSGVTSQAATAKEALDANTADMNSLISVLKAAGIADKDIQTSGFGVNPNYVYTDNRDGSGNQQPPKIAGYTVTNGVTVHVRDLTKLGAVLDQAVTVGANTISGITFDVEDPSGLYNQARQKAFADAKGKATLYAQAADSALGELLLINEQQGYTTPPQPMARMDLAAAPKAVPVQAGELTFSVDVNVNWALEPNRD